jgi:hypothetical protein
LTDECNVGVCNETTGACEADPVEDGTTCTHSDPCIEGESCQAGVCAGGTNTCGGCTDAESPKFCGGKQYTCKRCSNVISGSVQVKCTTSKRGVATASCYCESTKCVVLVNGKRTTINKGKAVPSCSAVTCTA